jgi:hypothetical protein
MRKTNRKIIAIRQFGESYLRVFRAMYIAAEWPVGQSGKQGLLYNRGKTLIE